MEHRPPRWHDSSLILGEADLDPDIHPIGEVLDQLLGALAAWLGFELSRGGGR